MQRFAMRIDMRRHFSKSPPARRNPVFFSLAQQVKGERMKELQRESDSGGLPKKTTAETRRQRVPQGM